MNNEDENFFPFDINYDMILDAEMMTCTHDCVRMVRKNEYLTVGEYITSLTTSQIQEMLEVAEEEDNPKMEEFLLISEMLSRAEGLDAAEDFDVMHRRVNILVGLVAIESLYRRGMVKAYHENFTFGDDENKKKIAEKI